MPKRKTQKNKTNKRRRTMSRKGGAIQSRSDTSSIKSKSSNNATILLKVKTIKPISRKDPILQNPDTKPQAPPKSKK